MLHSDSMLENGFILCILIKQGETFFKCEDIYFGQERISVIWTGLDLFEWLFEGEILDFQVEIIETFKANYVYPISARWQPDPTDVGRQERKRALVPIIDHLVTMS